MTSWEITSCLWFQWWHLIFCRFLIRVHAGHLRNAESHACMKWKYLSSVFSLFFLATGGAVFFLASHFFRLSSLSDCPVLLRTSSFSSATSFLFPITCGKGTTWKLWWCWWWCFFDMIRTFRLTNLSNFGCSGEEWEQKEAQAQLAAPKRKSARTFFPIARNFLGPRLARGATAARPLACQATQRSRAGQDCPGHNFLQEIMSKHYGWT